MKIITQFALFIAWLSPAFLGAQLFLQEDTELHVQAGSYLIANGLDLNFAVGSRTTNQGFIITDQNLLAEGTLFTTVSGITPGTHFGRWTGAISLEVDGTLIAVRDLAYQPLDRQIHKLLVSNDVVGEFETTILPGENWTFEYAQVSGTLVFDPALPVDWLSFTARVEGENVALDWQTVLEVNSNYFAIERLIGRGNWEEIGRVVSAGNSEEVQSYRFLDTDPATGVRLYYRLRQVDQDGQYAYSIIRSAQLGQGQLSVYPNPSSSPVYLNGPIAAATPIRLHDLNGRLVFETSFHHTLDAEMELVLPFDLPSATYQLEVEGFSPVLLYFRR